MPCDDVQLLLHGYLDGELDPVGSAEVERHMKDCPACATAYENQLALRSAISIRAGLGTRPHNCGSACPGNVL